MDAAGSVTPNCSIPCTGSDEGAVGPTRPPAVWRRCATSACPAAGVGNCQSTSRRNGSILRTFELEASGCWGWIFVGGLTLSVAGLRRVELVAWSLAATSGVVGAVRLSSGNALLGVTGAVGVCLKSVSVSSLRGSTMAEPLGLLIGGTTVARLGVDSRGPLRRASAVAGVGAVVGSIDDRAAAEFRARSAALGCKVKSRAGSRRCESGSLVTVADDCGVVCSSLRERVVAGRLGLGSEVAGLSRSSR